MGTSHLVTRGVARLVLRGKTRRAALAFLGRPFSSRARLRLAIHADINAITFAQVYPFFHEAAALWQRHGVEVRLFPFEALIEAPPCPADVALIAPWFDIPPDDLSRALDHLGRVVPEGQISFIDSYAPNDLRLARHLLGRVRFYFKKSLFRDPARFCQVYRGTQLQDHYSQLYGLEEPWADWGVPEAILPHLRLSPGFQMAPHLMGQFRAEAPPQRARRHDLQVRIEVKGTPWYQAMRQDALDHAQALQGVALTPPGRVSLRAYNEELRLSRLCFSPFGYGELCWRDIEAFAAGAVLIKPDMSHLETLPDLFEAGVTYLPTRWDFADLDAVVAGALADPQACQAMAHEAYRRVRDYLTQSRFVEDMGCLFA